MILCFIHDHPFYIDTENEMVYSGGGLPSRVWDNYLINFSKIIVFGRESSHIKDKKVVSSRSKVEFRLTRNYSSIQSLIKNLTVINTELNDVLAKADVVLVRLPSVLGAIAALLAMRKGMTVWVEQVGNAKEAMNTHGSISGKIIAPFFESINKYIVRKARYVTYVTAKQLQLIYPADDALATVNLSNVLINRVLNKSEVDDSRFFGRGIHIGLIGGFDAKYKGQDILLESISFLSEQIRREIRLSFVGKGDSSWLIAKAEALDLSKNIEFIGPLESGNRINEFLMSVSLYVQPSLTEGMPRSLIEAMAMGCPVIGSRVGGIPELVSPNYIHIRGNALQLSKHIEELYLNRDLLKKESDMSLEKVEDYKYDVLQIRRKQFYIKMNEVEKK